MGAVVAGAAITGTVAVLALTGSDGPEVDRELRRLVRDLGLEPLDPRRDRPPEMVALGRALYFDPILSGNRDISCATCHHPSHATGDGLSVSIGTGGVGLGPDRTLGEYRRLIPRNAPDVFNRGAVQWSSMFWDSRVTGDPGTGFFTPADSVLPSGLDSVLAVQAMFPVTSRDEMRGSSDDAFFGNELSVLDDREFRPIWDAIMNRLLEHQGYVDLFVAAYPGVPTESLGFEHAANAIAAFEASAFAFAETPWDRYLAGDDDALSEEAKRGALVFYGEARCGSCHSGDLLTDQRHHNMAVPQVGPGKGAAAPQDQGRGVESGIDLETYAFRTPPLRNVTLTGPWMHDGAYETLEGAVRHMLDPLGGLVGYDGSHLSREVIEASGPAGVLAEAIAATVDPFGVERVELSDEEFDDLMAFLVSLTDPAAADLDHLVPDRVPSGLPVDR